MAERHLATVTDLAPGKPSVIPSQAEWGTIYQMAKALLPTGFLPAHIKTPEQATAIILKGRELSVPPMYALSNIAVINGKPTCMAELMQALIYRDHGDDALRFTTSTNERATLTYQRRSWDAPLTYSFTIEDARLANLNSNTWKQYPAAMLRSRCISAVARMAFADSIGGMYTPEELGGAVRVVDDVVIYEPTPDTEPAPFVANLSEVIDRETGEITQPSPQAADDPEKRQVAQDSVFAVGNGKGLAREDIKTIAYHKYKVDSMTKLNVEQLRDYYRFLNKEDLEGLQHELYQASQQSDVQDAEFSEVSS